MTERTIEHIAKEFAGEFYDFVRSKEDGDDKVQMKQRGRILLQIDPKLFSKCYPKVKDYLAGRRHGRMQRNWVSGQLRHIDDGKVYQEPPGWMHWYDLARQRAVEMLTHPHVTEHLKSAIIDALLEDREKQLRQEARHKPFANIPQRHIIGSRE